mgnify:CR=1 FL=1
MLFFSFLLHAVVKECRDIVCYYTAIFLMYLDGMPLLISAIVFATYALLAAEIILRQHSCCCITILCIYADWII